MRRRFRLLATGMLSCCLVLPFGACAAGAINGILRSFKPCDVLNCENTAYFDPCALLQCSGHGHIHVVGGGRGDAESTGSGSTTNTTSSSDSGTDGQGMDPNMRM
jgi:hypothetical protein